MPSREKKGKRNSRKAKFRSLHLIIATAVFGEIMTQETKSPTSPKYKVEVVTEIDEERDGPTPDNWIPRHKDLIRLTGLCPFNAEPPLTKLMKQGLITPNSLHYVRNHGVVPRLEWNSHKVIVNGLVKKQREFTMDELTSMTTIRLPVTIACDGNRRKELNMIKQTRGFNWGAGAVSTAYWKGIKLYDVLSICDVDLEKGRYVCFEGADDLPKGKYGTSISLGYIMNPDNDVILAYEMNDEKLPPDHGFPVRLVVPGFIGGRMVKWLSKITVTEEESNNYYHTHDNKVFPSNLDETSVESKNLWEQYRHTLYELNINSVISSPTHYEILSVDYSDSDEMFEMGGYAYSGGGRSIIRVEISTDDGLTWEECTIDTLPVQDSIRHGYKCFIWVHWKMRLPSWKALRAREIIVRAIDASNNTQPSKHYWNLMGMMNNCYYRIKVQAVQLPHKSPSVVFNHPVQPGSIYGGWMIKPGEKPNPTPPTMVIPREISLDEVAQHNKPDDCWVTIDNEVFDLTSYLQEHPGGQVPIWLCAGGDATRVFHEIHSKEAYKCKQMFRIGKVVHRHHAPLPKEINYREIALNPRKWIEMALIARSEISSDSRKFKFQLVDGKNLKIGLPIGQHILLGVNMGSHFVVRPYTPIAPIGLDEDDGSVELVVKIYFAGKNPIFPQGGIMSQYLDKMKVGDKMLIKGPAGHVLYHGQGNFTVGSKSFKVNRVNLVGGGTGITPLYQLAQAIMKDTYDKTNVSLVYANNTLSDILLKDQLDAMKEKNSSKFKLWYTIATAPKEKEWKYDIGFISRRMLKKTLFPPSDASVTFVCGPPGMIEGACFPYLEEMGFTEHNLFEF